MGSLAYYNGAITDYSHAKISLRDRAVFFGDGVYDVMIAGKVKIYQQQIHLQRLERNAARIGLICPEELDKTVSRMVRLAGLETCSVYVQLSRTSEERVHAPSEKRPPSVLITVSEISIPSTSPHISTLTAEDIRYRMCDVKTLNLLPSVLASIKANEMDCEEAIFVRDGIVTEGAKSNLFTVKDGVLYTHPRSRSILPGITRENVIRLAERESIECREICFDTDFLFSADEVFITSTTKLLRHVGQIDGKTVGNGYYPVSAELGRLLCNEVINSI